MSNSFLSSRAMMGAAIVGLVGAAGVFIYEQIYAEKRRAMLVKEVARLDGQVNSMRTELETIRELQKESELRRQKHKERLKEKQRAARRERADRAERAPAGDTRDTRDRRDKRDKRHTRDVVDSYASDSEYYTDYQSVAGTDHEMDSEEFYDVHTDDDDEVTLKPDKPVTRNDITANGVRSEFPEDTLLATPTK